MASIAISAHNVSKLYRLGARGPQYNTIRDLIVDIVKTPVRNLRELRRLTSFDNGDNTRTVKALDDVSFEVSEGEVLGIIGRNGAGKTTVLKILSRITDPSSGHIEIRGRVSSLLEVGTGFHPELTGRQNIFLNGAILGMRKREIESRYDDIVAFAELERHIDTPVKRYSSGMFVRLAFSVAAHLEPEILLVDEVLAVGDLAFQQKCLGRMGDMVKGGRTVLFVSHNMGIIQSLCENIMWLDNGKIVERGKAADVVKHYQDTMSSKMDAGVPVAERGQEDRVTPFYFNRVELMDAKQEKTTTFKYGDHITLLVEMGGKPDGGYSPEFRIYNELGQLVTTGAAAFHGQYFEPETKRLRIDIGPLPLTSGKYTVSLSVMVMPGNRRLDTWKDAIGFTIVSCQPFELPWEIPTAVEGACVINHSFSEVS